jgi:hypothetical protein
VPTLDHADKLLRLKRCYETQDAVPRVFAPSSHINLK